MARGITKKGAQFSGHRNVPKCHKYFLQCRKFASERAQVRTWGRQTCFLPRAPSKLVTPLVVADIGWSGHRILKCEPATSPAPWVGILPLVDYPFVCLFRNRELAPILKRSDRQRDDCRRSNITKPMRLQEQAFLVMGFTKRRKANQDQSVFTDICVLLFGQLFVEIKTHAFLLRFLVFLRCATWNYSALYSGHGQACCLL